MEDEDVSIHKDALLKYFKIDFVQLCMRNPISDVCGQCLIQTFCLAVGEGNHSSHSVRKINNLTHC